MKVRLALIPRNSGGEPCATPVVMLRVRDRYGALAEVQFRVDTQADVTTIPISLAERERLPFTKTRPGTVRGISGSVVKYRDRVRIVIAGREHDWPCDFTEPALDPVSRRPLADLPPILGRAGLLEEYAIALDSGYVIITRIGPIRRWLRRRLHHLWAWRGMVHPGKQPL